MMNEDLQTLLDRVLHAQPGSAERFKASDQLIRQLMQLPGLYYSSHPGYPDVLADTWKWVLENLETFQPDENIATSFVRWINGRGRLKWRVQDLYRSSTQQLKRFADLEQLKELGEEPAAMDLTLPTLSSLDHLILAERQQAATRVRQYVEADPDQTLQKCYPRNYPDCHCQTILLQAHFQEPPISISTLAQTLKIKRPTLDSHYKTKCLALLRTFLIHDVGYNPEIDQ